MMKTPFFLLKLAQIAKKVVICNHQFSMKTPIFTAAKAPV
jgi:hypothetical protein